MFFFLGGAGSCFRAGLKKSRAGAEISREGCPRPDLTSLKVRGGDFNVPLMSWIDWLKLQTCDCRFGGLRWLAIINNFKNNYS
jgi:hypothetical protein